MEHLITLGKKLFILAIVPVCIGLLSFLLFHFIQSSYTAEARIRVFPEMLGEPTSSRHSLVNMEAHSHNKVSSLIASMKSERAIRLLALSLAAHDLTANQAFSQRQQAIERLHREDRAILATAFREKLAALETEFGPSSQDSMMSLLLRRLGYTSASLSDKISISRVPGGTQIRIQGHGYTPEMSTYMVNSFCEEFIRYQLIVEKERIESSIDLLGQIADQKRSELEEKTSRLRNKRQALRSNDSNQETRDLLHKISQLESRYQKQQLQIKALQEEIDQQNDHQKNPQIIAVRWIHPTQQTDGQTNLAIQLGSAMAHLKFMEEELKHLQEQLSKKEDALLATYEEEVIASEQAYLEILNKLREAEISQTRLEQSLVLVARGTSRFPNPMASQFMGILAGLTSFFLWLIWLFQVKYLRWTNRSARILPLSQYPNDH
ncbi:MAG: hypothetical protein AAF587_05330 [Bacteroidota bacterium]